MKLHSELTSTMLILCDFDGTITVQDITNLIWDTHIRPDWREHLLPPYREGKMSPIELMATGYKDVKASEEELLALIRPRVELRDGFHEFHQSCLENNWPFHVVSQGLDWYIRAYLPTGIPFSSLSARHLGHWRVSLPNGLKLEKSQDYKVHVLEQLKREHTPESVVFIGDGRNDFPIAQKADKVFALKGSTLAWLCKEHKVKFTEFETFHEVMDALGE